LPKSCVAVCFLTFFERTGKGRDQSAAAAAVRLSARQWSADCDPQSSSLFADKMFPAMFNKT
jgi:hypothetical protein